MTDAALGWWVQDLLVQHLGCTRAEAERASAPSRRDPVLTATTIATVAQATPHLPGGRAWWTGEGAEARALLLEGRPDRAERLVRAALRDRDGLDGIAAQAQRMAEMVFAASDDPGA